MPLLLKGCTRCAGALTWDRGEEEWVCIACGWRGGVAIAPAPVARTSEYQRCEVCGSRQRGPESMRAHVRSSHSATTRQGKRGPALGAVAPTEISAVYGKPR